MSPTPVRAWACLTSLFSVICLSEVMAPVAAAAVFIFAGQSNMVGSDSKVEDIKNFPPFVGLDKPQSKVKFAYNIGREHKLQSDGWTDLQPVDNVVGPELSFARAVSSQLDAPIAIIKCAAGGTHLGGDWNPDKPEGFKMYPLALKLVEDSLAELDRQEIPYQLEGFMWHQGENDMFNAKYMDNYGENLKNFVACWRRDLKAPKLHFYIGELCTKTIWGMDLRPRMYAISKGQKSVADADPLVQYVPTSHVGVEIGGGVGLHYHYGTLGQLEHGVNYADAYLRNVGLAPDTSRPLKSWPYAEGKKVRLFILAGHRNMEGERAFVQQVMESQTSILRDNPNIAYKYRIGGGYQTSQGWEPLGPAGYYDTFGPELSFAATLAKSEKLADGIAIAKFTHSGSQIIDWTPDGSEATARNLYPDFIDFVRQSVKELEDHGQEVELAGIFYHLGENDMSFGPFRRSAASNLKSMVDKSREDLGVPTLRWYVSQQPPTNHESVNAIDVVADVEKVAAADHHLIHLKDLDFPEQPKQLVLNTAGVISLGEQLAQAYLQSLAKD